MLVQRVVIRGLRALRDRDDLLSVDGVVQREVCLRGLNGCGKSTWLQAVAEMFAWWRRCSKRRAVRPAVKTSLLREAELVGVRVSELEGPLPAVWLVYGRPAATRAFVEGLGEGEVSLTLQHEGPAGFLEQWDERWSQAELGIPGADEFPANLVHLNATARFSRKPTSGELLQPRPTPAWLPVADFDAANRGSAHLDGMVRALYLARRDRWELLRKVVHELRPRLQLADRFDTTSLRPLFLLDDETWLTSDHLSAGEQALLITLVSVLRWLARGGVVLVDEPELHQHVALVRANLQVLAWLVVEKLEGQLITASHASEVWEHHITRGMLLDLDER